MTLPDLRGPVQATPARFDLSGGPPGPMPPFVTRPRSGAELLDEAAAAIATPAQPSSSCRSDASTEYSDDGSRPTGGPPRLTPAIAAFVGAMFWALELDLDGDDLSVEGVRRYARALGADFAIVGHARERRGDHDVAWQDELGALVGAAVEVLEEHAVDPSGRTVLRQAARALAGELGSHVAAGDRTRAALGVDEDLLEPFPFGRLLRYALGSLEGASGADLEHVGPHASHADRDALLMMAARSAMQSLQPSANRPVLAAHFADAFADLLDARLRDASPPNDGRRDLEPENVQAALLDGARAAADFYAAAAAVEPLGGELGPVARCAGVDVLLWQSVRDLGGRGAARRLLAPLCALDEELLGPAVRVLADFPDGWVSTHAFGVLAMVAREGAAIAALGRDGAALPAFAGCRPGDPPEGTTPLEQALVELVFMAYPNPAGPDPLARNVLDLMVNVAAALDGDRAALLAFLDAVRAS